MQLRLPLPLPDPAVPRCGPSVVNWQLQALVPLLLMLLVQLSHWLLLHLWLQTHQVWRQQHLPDPLPPQLLVALLLLLLAWMAGRLPCHHLQL
jgi:hypothetical protein